MNTTTQHLTAWQYIVDQNDAPTTCKTIGKELLRQYTRAFSLAEQKAKQEGELRERAADKTRNIMPTLKREIGEGNKSTLSDLVANELKADEAHRIAMLEKKYADQLVASLRTHALLTLRQHRAELLQWIATRRISDIHTPNYTALITPELQDMYQSLDILWQGKWNEGLALGNISRLPLVFHEGWLHEQHASVAWVWQRIALGDVREKDSRHYIAAYLDQLPTIEKPQDPPRLIVRPF